MRTQHCLLLASNAKKAGGVRSLGHPGPVHHPRQEGNRRAPGSPSTQRLSLLPSLVLFSGRTELMLMATRELLRIPQAALAKPVSTPSNLISLFSRYVDQQKLNLLETKLQ